MADIAMQAEQETLADSLVAPQDTGQWTEDPMERAGVPSDEEMAEITAPEPDSLDLLKEAIDEQGQEFGKEAQPEAEVQEPEQPQEQVQTEEVQQPEQQAQTQPQDAQESPMQRMITLPGMKERWQSQQDFAKLTPEQRQIRLHDHSQQMYNYAASLTHPDTARAMYDDFLSIWTNPQIQEEARPMLFATHLAAWGLNLMTTPEVMHGISGPILAHVWDNLPVMMKAWQEHEAKQAKQPAQQAKPAKQSAKQAKPLPIAHPIKLTNPKPKPAPKPQAQPQAKPRHPLVAPGMEDIFDEETMENYERYNGSIL